MASNKAQLMAQFYEQCQKKGYTDMRDATQSLKAKVIATDLGLRYGNIVEFYEKAAQCYQQVQDENTREAERLRIQKQEEQAENTRRAVNGTLLVTISDSKTTLKVYLRPDGTTYCTVNDGGKIEGIPNLGVHKGGNLQYTYHPSETVFTGASSGGIMMGGTHQTEAYYSERVSKSGKGYIKATIGGTEVSVTLVTMSEYTQACFKRDEQFKRLVSNGRIRCTKDSEMANILARSALSGGGDIYMQMSQLTMAADEKRLPYETCKEITDLLGRIIYGYFPPTDAENYDRAKKLAEGETSEQLMRAIEAFRKISDYKDSSERIKALQSKYEEVLQTEKEQAILDRESRDRLVRKVSLLAATALIVIVLVVVSITVISKYATYRDAMNLLDAGMLEEAVAVLEELDEYKDRINQIQKDYYSIAEGFEEAGDPVHAAFTFAKIPDYQDARTRSFELWDKILTRKTISAEYDSVIGIRTDGTVVLTGELAYDEDTSGWTNITEVSSEIGHIVGLRADGTVVATGSSYYGEGDVGHWCDIVSVVTGFEYSVGLRSDGTVVATGNNEENQCNVSDWSDIIAISSDGHATYGLCVDGTVMSTQNSDRLSVWEDIVSISAGSWYTMGLKADGTVVATGLNEDVSKWKNIMDVAAGSWHMVGLRADGTVVATGNNDHGQCNVSSWRNIVAVAAGTYRTFGLKEDGTVVVTEFIGDSYRKADYQDDASTWTDIKLPN